MMLITIGNSAEVIGNDAGIDTLHFGYMNGDRLKSIVYSAADLLIFPSRADNLPLVLQESMACGTPIVAFNIGGIPDLIRPGVSGYLAMPLDPKDLCRGTIQLLEDNMLRQHMKQMCRKIIREEFPLELQAQRYMNLYTHALQDYQENR